MKTLILSCNTGGGHNTAGRALLEELNRRDLPAEMLDALSFGRKHTSRIVSQSYISVASVTPKLFGGIYHLGDFISSSHRKSPVYLANAAYAERLNRFLEAQRYTDVVCTASRLSAVSSTQRDFFRQKDSGSARNSIISTPNSSIHTMYCASLPSVVIQPI